MQLNAFSQNIKQMNVRIIVRLCKHFSGQFLYYLKMVFAFRDVCFKVLISKLIKFLKYFHTFREKLFDYF